MNESTMTSADLEMAVKVVFEAKRFFFTSNLNLVPCKISKLKIISCIARKSIAAKIYLEGYYAGMLDLFGE